MAKRGFAAAVLPFRCLLCHAATPQFGGVCAPCAAHLRPLQHTGASCRWCAQPRAAPVCGACLQQPPHFDKITAAFVYGQPLARLIHLFKYEGQWQLAKTLARLMPPPPRAELALATPLHVERERRRGYNQARELAKKAGLAPAEGAVERVVNTTPQAEMPRIAERRKNVRGAFAVVGNVRGRRVLLVDDVMTTGATLNELARVLKAAGAAAVEGYVLARVAAP